MGLAGASMLGTYAYRSYGIPNNVSGFVSDLVPGSLRRIGGSGMNAIVIIVDSLRKDHVGIYGNDRIQTPNMDALGRESLRFTRAQPESMPTVCARRAIHTGMRSWPFRDYEPPRYDNVKLYGWMPIQEDRRTLAEILGGAGYATMFVTDAYHQFKPAYNFNRGFGAFSYVRGQEMDRYRPRSMCPEEIIEGSLLKKRLKVEGKLRQHFANASARRTEEDYFAPQVFLQATELLEGAGEARDPFFMVIDAFDPHEPWDPPEEYVRLYGDGYGDREPYVPVYGDAGYLSEAELERMKVLYAAEVTMVDRWMGRFLDRAEELGLMEDTVIMLVSDHGLAFGEHGVVGKPPYALWPEVTDIPFFLRHPDGTDAAGENDYRASTHDVAPTLLGALDLGIPDQMDGQDLSVLLDGGQNGREPEPRPYLAAGFHDYAWARDDEYALICRNNGSEARLYDLKADPDQQNDIADRRRDVADRMFREYVVEGAGGEPPPNYDV